MGRMICKGELVATASPCNISRILWNLRLEQDDVILSHDSWWSSSSNIHTRSLSDKNSHTARSQAQQTAWLQLH